MKRVVLPADRSEAPRKHTPVSLPWKSVERPALRFASQGTDVPLEVRLTDELSSLRQTITTPDGDSGRGPALTGRTPLPVASAWTAHTLCLDPYSVNRPTTLAFSTYAPPNGCGGQTPCR